ncbi:gliding motility-associated C-terminal domain-containing protein, partial [Flavobacteriaceae bacterium]|nr:gliding motility-associated C-terminal domain-containing protein [Flavobacteriaceae bacterium]
YPAWFYLQIDTPGDLDFEIVQNTEFDTNGDPIGTGLDVDYIAWGPFAQGDDLCDYNQLQQSNQIGCSYSAAPIENFSITNAQTGEIYVLLITNYNQSAGFIKLVQTGGIGTTNCDIIFTCSIDIDDGDQVLCDDSETTLTTTTSGPVESYQWYLNNTEIVGATTDNLIVSESGIYKVIINGVECEQPAEDEVNISFVELFSVDLGEDQGFCDAASFEIVPNIEGDTSNVTYLWSTGETTPTITVSVSDSYSLVITSETCEVTDVVNLLFEDTPLFDLGEDFETCFENTIQLDATPSNVDVSSVTYSWSTGETTSIITVDEAGIYTVTASFGNCEIEDSITISDRTDLEINLGEDFQTCFENTIQLDATPSNIDVSSVTYSWSTGETTSIITVDEAGIYTVTASFGNCEIEDSITISDRTDLEINLSDDFKSCVGESWTLTATTTEEEISYQWYLNEGLLLGETNNTLDLTITDEISGAQTYSVVLSKGSCTASDELVIELYDVANCVISEGISPDATPGFNDYLDLEFLSDRVGGITNLQIFNRFGTIIYEQVNYVNQWNGQDNSENELPTGTYYYVINLASVDDIYGSQTSGWIYLNRSSN